MSIQAQTMPEVNQSKVHSDFDKMALAQGALALAQTRSTQVKTQAEAASLINYLLAVMEAVTNSINAGQNQQLADANMATQDATIEQDMINHYQTVLSDKAPATINPDATHTTHLGYWVQYWAKQVAAHPNDKKAPAELTTAQAAYQNANTTQQTRTNGADSATQTAQTQTGQDSTLMQMKVQLETAITQIEQALSSALAS